MLRLISSFCLIIAVTTSTGCLGLAEAFIEGFNQGASDQPAPSGTGDCHDAVATCEGLVTASCNRFAACGLVESFDKCKSDLESGSLPCAQADAADDFTQCDADLGAESCDDLAAQKQPSSCTAPRIHFADVRCE